MLFLDTVKSSAKARMAVKSAVPAVVVILLLGCSGRQYPAPVENVYVKSAGKSGIVYASFSDQKTYRVKKGDTLYSIAWRAGIDFRQLARINHIRTPYQIFPGQLIHLSTKQSKPNNTKASQTVVKNKTTVSPKNVAKTLATQKQGEYVQKEKNKKSLAKSNQSVSDKHKKKRFAKSTNKTYSNKIKQWVWPTSGRIVAAFSNKENGNKGIDIAGKLGTSIVSAADGKVVYYGNALRGYGNLIIIKHNDDYLSAYAHNRKVLVKEKEFVKAGQKIAEMGDSDSDQVKLHFEVRFRGKSVNPLKYLPKR